MSTDVVVMQEIPLSNGYCLGHATLNHEASLNALSGDMIERLLPQLIEWEANPQIAAVWLDGMGERAFCAGGNVVQVYHDMVDARLLSHDELPDVPAAQQYFSMEYELDLRLHQYTKPLIVWGSGIVMGGGMGLLQGARFRMVTESSRLAMPEITIGLYPDVGASWFLNRTPGHLGLFLALTGAQFNATDALFAGLADRFALSTDRNAILQALGKLAWTGNPRVDEVLIDHTLKGFEQQATDSRPEGNLQPRFEQINSLMDHVDLASIYHAITTLEGTDAWLTRAANTLRNGSPASAVLIYEQLRRAKYWSIEETFDQELIVSTQCCRHGEFQEGVRALLIDKDRQPNWRFKTIDAVDPAYIQAHFIAP
ncbi:enoyl-CoA hydratase/isomerase family protein [Salinispirillum marinum]|uniref:3-hydroxyisobutyryl-CoA hydrolase n=2 Tax=Saccharospirillaceae TaxID=255527 RepID=A0ABV8BH18_9GAMM